MVTHLRLESLESRDCPAALDLTGASGPVDVHVLTSGYSTRNVHVTGGGVDGNYTDISQILATSGSTIDYSDWTSAVTVNLTAGTASGFTGGISGFENAVGGSGNDFLTGNAAANILTGNAGNDILIGMDGDDTLRGGAGNDILVGGVGADDLDGREGDDILIGGYTDYDVNAAALIAIRGEWSLTIAATTRQSHIRGNTSGGLNKTYYFNATHVHDDATADTLADTGTTGLDWFFVGAGDSASGNDLSNN